MATSRQASTSTSIWLASNTGSSSLLMSASLPTRSGHTFELFMTSNHWMTLRGSPSQMIGRTSCFPTTSLQLLQIRPRKVGQPMLRVYDEPSGNPVAPPLPAHPSVKPQPKEKGIDQPFWTHALSFSTSRFQHMQCQLEPCSQLSAKNRMLCSAAPFQCGKFCSAALSREGLGTSLRLFHPPPPILFPFI